MKALAAPGGDLMRHLLHPDFIAVHGPTGKIQGAEEFLTESASRPPNRDPQVLESTMRQIGDVVTTSGIEEYRIAFVPDATPFVIQAAVSRVWLRGVEGWKLIHLQMARRNVPG